uniref:Uncharacterized protein n=1 Tax=Romanomermis culicivorax TaxID=13658 RepID=A0A915K4Y1_ROMCU
MCTSMTCIRHWILPYSYTRLLQANLVQAYDKRCLISQSFRSSQKYTYWRPCKQFSVPRDKWPLLWWLY